MPENKLNLSESKRLLHLLTVRVSPGKDMRHNLTLNSDGNLEINLMLDQAFWPVVLEESDLIKSAEELAIDICNTVANCIPGQSIEYETVDGKWWEYKNGFPVRQLTDEEAAIVIWGSGKVG